MPMPEHIVRVVDEWQNLFLGKLADYGTADMTRVGVPGVINRLYEKLDRAQNLTNKGVANNESVRDTLLDVMGYGLIGVLLLDGTWEKGEEVKHEVPAGETLQVQVLAEGEPDISGPAKAGDVGYDLTVAADTVIPPLSANGGLATIVPSAVRCKIPDGYWAQIVGRSSASNKLGILVHTATIDNGYTGQLFACCWNMSDHPVTVHKGTRLAQAVFHRAHTPAIKIVPELPTTERGATGFGSTGGHSVSKHQ